MSKLIKQAVKGYKVVENEEFILANRLIPFGMTKDFELHHNSDLKEEEYMQSVKDFAQSYANDREASYHEFKYMRKGTISPTIEGEIQLYVDNLFFHNPTDD